MHNENCNGRNIGIDMLRLVCMFFVVVLHVLGHGGVLESAEAGVKALCWFIEIGVFCAVNCFLMITGFVSYSETEKGYNYERILSTWTQVVFYSLSITLISYLLNYYPLRPSGIVQAMIPIATNRYWFFNVYFGVVILGPWLNRLIHRLSEREATELIVVAFVVFSCYSTISRQFSDAFNLQNGYSFVWGIFMYTIGSWMKKCAIPEKIGRKLLIVIAGLCLIVTWITAMLVPKEFGGMLLASYISPTIVLTAFAYLAVFSKIKVGKAMETIIRHFSSATFGVYLIHDHPFVRDCLLHDSFAWIASIDIWLIPLAVFGVSLLLYCACLLVEKTRSQLFDVLRINRGVKMIANRLKLAMRTLVD